MKWPNRMASSFFCKFLRAKRWAASGQGNCGRFHDFAICGLQVAGRRLPLAWHPCAAKCESDPDLLKKAMPRILDEPRPRRPAYVWWLLANALALCFAVISWGVCLLVFKNIEIPRNYEILRKLHRLPALQAYTALDAPNGTALGPKELYQKFFGLGPKDLERVNSLLLRNYLTNFERPLLLTYIEGDYQVAKVRQLDNADFFNPGFVIRAQALVKPDEFSAAAAYPVQVEYVFPTADVAAGAFFKSGDVLGVRKSPNCAAVAHVAKTTVAGEGVLLLTVIPIAYGPYQIGAVRSFDIQPPAVLRPGAAFPMLGN